MTSDPLRVLTIGNSFTDSLRPYAVAVARAAGCALHLDFANFGGCSLERHWAYIAAEEAEPVCRIYRGGGIKMRDILASQPWDVVTIQQASHESWRPETFQPFGRRIADYVRRHAPGAECVVQQTWVYRADDPRLRPGGEWNIDPDEMYRRLTAHYRTLAADLGGLRIIPTGYAVRLARASEPKPFANYDPSLLATLAWPDLPPQGGDVVGRAWWAKNEASGELEIRRDLIHLNERGQYLQACVWFARLFGRPVEDTASFVPSEIGQADAARLRDAAQRAVDGFMAS